MSMTHDQRIELKEELIEVLNKLDACVKSVVPEIKSDINSLNETLNIIKCAKIRIDHTVTKFSINNDRDHGIAEELFRSNNHVDHIKSSIEKVDRILMRWIEYSKTIENIKESNKTEIEQYLKKLMQ